MLKVTCLLLLIAVANGNDLERFVGDWNILNMFPNPVFYPKCMKITVSSENRSVKCKCGSEETEYPVFQMYLHRFHIPYVYNKPTDAVTKSVAIKFVEDYTVVTQFLKTDCSCDEYFPRPEVMRFLNDDYMVYYTIQNHPYHNETEPNTAFLSSKLWPTRGELRQVVQADEELKSRDAVLLCQDLKY